MPDWTPPFEFAAGSVVGHEHVRRGPMFVGANNQDCHVVGISPVSGCLIGVISDGCSSHERSELGAMVSASSVWKTLAHRVSTEGDLWDEVLHTVKHCLVTSLSTIGAMVVFEPESYFFATVIGFVVGRTATTVFHVGDGFHCVNGQVERVLPASGNRPPYPVYGTLLMPLTDDEESAFESEIGPDPFSFRRVVWPTDEVSSILVGSDGVGDLIAAEGLPMPFQPSQRVPGLPSLWTDDTWYSSPHRIKHLLAACNNETVRANPEGGLDRRRALLPDDTTVIVARRTGGAE